MSDKDVYKKKSVREQRDNVGLKHMPAERLFHNMVHCKQSPLNCDLTGDESVNLRRVKVNLGRKGEERAL